MIQIQQERSPFAQDLCRCSRCGVTLSRYDFGFNAYGQTLEICPACGPRVLVLRRGAPLFRQPHPKAKASGKCLDCPEVLSYVTSHPLRCQPCQKAHQKTQAREYQREVAAHLRTPVPRRFSA